MKCYWRLAGIGIKQTYGNRSLGHIFQFPVKTVFNSSYIYASSTQGGQRNNLFFIWRIWHLFVTLETRKELGPKCAAQLFLESLPGTRLPIFVPVSSNSPRGLCKNQLGPVSFSFLRCRIVARGYSCSHVRNCSWSMATFHLLTPRRLLRK